MTKVPCAVILILWVAAACAQDTRSAAIDSSGHRVYTVVDRMPEFKGGEAALKQFVNDHIYYPVDAYEIQIQGNEIVSFIVDDNGDLDSIRVTRKVYQSLDEAAVRTVALTQGHWVPGRQDGRNVSVRYILPLRFRLPYLSEPDMEPVLNPNVKDDDELKANRAYINGNFTKALKLYQAVCERAPKNDYARHNLGLCLYRTHHVPEACEEWRKIRDRDTHTADFLLDEYDVSPAAARKLKGVY